MSAAIGRRRRLARLARWASAAGMLALLASPVHAVSVTIAHVESTGSFDSLVVGDAITLGIQLGNPDQELVAGIGIEAFGWDPTVLRGIGFEAAESVFNREVVSVESGLVGIGGLANFAASWPGSGAIADQRFELIAAVSLSPASGTGANDVGVDGGLVSDGDVHARMTFEVIGPGATSVRIGASFENGDAVVLQTPGGVVQRETNIAQLDIMLDAPAYEPPPPPPDDDPVSGSPPAGEEPPSEEPPPAPEAPPAEDGPPLIVILGLTIFPPDFVFPDGAIFLPLSEIPDGFPEDTIFIAGSPPFVEMPPEDTGAPGHPIPEPTTGLLVLVGLVLLPRGAGGRRRTGPARATPSPE